MKNYNEINFLQPVVQEIDVTVKTVTVIPDALNFRAEPSDNGRIIKQIGKGTVLTVTGENSGGWMSIEHENAKGWVWSELVE